MGKIVGFGDVRRVRKLARAPYLVLLGSLLSTSSMQVITGLALLSAVLRSKPEAEL